MKLHLVPMTLREANAIVESHHRHSKPVRGMKWAVGASDGEEMAGVAIVGRPVARRLQDGVTAEVLRLCTLPPFERGGAKARVGDHASCVPGFLYAACWRAWRAMGGRRLVTYTLQSESGVSPGAAGAKLVAELPVHKGDGWLNRAGGREWQPVYGQSKFRWEWADG